MVDPPMRGCECRPDPRCKCDSAKPQGRAQPSTKCRWTGPALSNHPRAKNCAKSHTPADLRRSWRLNAGNRKEQQFDLRPIQGFLQNQFVGDSLQVSPAARQNCLRPQIKSVRNSAHFVIDGFGCSFTVIAFLGHERKSQNLSSVRSAVGDVAKPITHAEPHHHLPYEFGRALKVVPCSG